MSYTVSFGVMTKRENSTKQGYTEALSASCLLKETTDVYNPTFTIQGQIVGDTLLPCNYMYVASFGRYYWITEISFYHGVWTVSGETDVLATFKSDIGNTTTYIHRAASQHDEQVADGFYTLECVPTGSPVWVASGMNTTGIVLVCVLGNDGNDTSCYYALEPYTWARLYSLLYTSSFLNDYGTFWSNIATDIFNTIINPGDYISSAIWLPVSYNDVSGTPQNISIATHQTSFMGKKITPNSLLLYKSLSLTLPNHPQEATNGQWMRGSRCSKDKLLLPGYGEITLNSDVIASMAVRDVSIAYAIDCSGAITYNVAYGGQYVYCNADIAIPCGYGDSRPNFAQALGSLINTGAGIATGNVGAIAHGVLDAQLSALPSMDRISSGGSRTLPTVQPYIMSNSIFYLLPVDAYDNAGSGRPLAKTCQISTLSGFMICASTVSVECTGATRSEIERINNYLTGGFYYE